MLTTALIMTMAVAIAAALIEHVLNRHPRRTRRLSVVRYVLYLAAPMLASAILITVEPGLVIVFAASMLVGIILEWLLGYYFRRIVGFELWSYRGPGSQRYTSLLVLPLWGLAGVLFVVLGSVLLPLG
jgi:hypothetical protein